MNITVQFEEIQAYNIMMFKEINLKFFLIVLFILTNLLTFIDWQINK